MDDFEVEDQDGDRLQCETVHLPSERAPERVLFRMPQRRGTPCREVFLTSDQCRELAAWLVQAADEPPILRRGEDKVTLLDVPAGLPPGHHSVEIVGEPTLRVVNGKVSMETVLRYLPPGEEP